MRRFGIGGSRLRALLVLGGLLFSFQALVLVGLSWKVYERLGNGPSAMSENLVLRARLQGLERRQTELDKVLERVMAHDAKLRRMTGEDAGARALGIGPLSELELAAAERDGRSVTLPGEQVGLDGGQSDELAVLLDELELRGEQLSKRLLREEESLQEVRGYLEDRSSLQRANPSIWPVRGWLTSGYGWRRNPVLRTRQLHTGLDIAAPRGTPVMAPADGHVVFAGYHSAFGNMVVIDHGYGITTKYAHTSHILVEVGDRVFRGDMIAKVGNTGRSTGPHLHYEVHRDGRPLNPMRFLRGG
ncbi:MAG: peptidase M23 [Rickettsiales bacterium]|nr:peptidase M23 [Rickettsiales bacterium]|tara:strand:- start:2450 stop:3355 length:906 start_codon:yes stop_codon:yes gene_type:complete